MATLIAEEDIEPLSREDFDRMYNTGLSWVKGAYKDYDDYLVKHAPDKCDPDWGVLDPFHIGLMAHPWDVEDQLAAIQRERFERGLPLLKAKGDDASYLDFEGAKAAEASAA